MTGYICNLVIPGAAKSGTSSLHDLLDQHPELNMSRPKEPQHFSHDKLYRGGAEAHNALFKSDKAYRYHGESSQCYMVHPHAMTRIKERLASPKIILLLRDPVDRLWSHYRSNYKLGIEKEALTEAISTRGEDTGYDFNPTIGMYKERGGYLSFSRYSKWVPLWREEFGTENVLVVRTEDLRADPAHILQTCFAFLGVEALEVQDGTLRNDTGTKTRLPPLFVARAERHMPRALRWSRPYTALRWQALRALTPTPPDAMSPEEKNLVHDCLREDIAFHESLAT